MVEERVWCKIGLLAETEESFYVFIEICKNLKLFPEIIMFYQGLVVSVA